MSNSLNYNPATLHALEDAELSGVVGGYQVVFRENGVNRDSWFVSLMTRRMIQERLRELDSTPGAIPGVLDIEGRKYSITKSGDNIFVEEIL